MSLKRTLSKKFKNTLEKTKRIVSPSISFKKSISSNDSNESTNTSISQTSEIGLGNGNSTDILSSSNQRHAPSDSISSIQKSVSHIILRSKSDQNIMDPLSQGDNLNDQPTLLYTNGTLRKRSVSIRRSKKSLDFIDASDQMDITNNADDTNYSIHSNSNSIQPSINLNGLQRQNTVILLPIDPIDKTIPPYTTEQLTPITPLPLEGFVPDYLSSSNSSNMEKSTLPPLIVSNISNTTSVTLNSIDSSRNTPITANSSPFTSNNYNTTIEFDEIIQSDVNPIFTKSNQIDHLDKDLDLKKNDKLADQMALNILQNITEENVDELSKLKEEIRMSF